MKPIMGGRAVDIGRRSIVIMSLLTSSVGLCQTSEAISEQKVVQQLQERLDEIAQEEAEAQNYEQQLLYRLQQRPDQQPNIEAEYAKLQQKRQSRQTERDQILTVLQDPQLLQQALQKLKQDALPLDPSTITPEQKEIWFNTPAQPAPQKDAETSESASKKDSESSTEPAPAPTQKRRKNREKSAKNPSTAKPSAKSPSRKKTEKSPSPGQPVNPDFDRVAEER